LEYGAVREKAGIIDMSHDGKYFVSGEDRVTFLQNVMSNDIQLASDKRGIISALLTAKGKVISRFFLCLLPHAYFIEIESGVAEKTVGHFMKYKMRSKIKIEMPQWGKLLVSGPSAKALLEAFLKRPLSDMEERSFFFQEDARPLRKANPLLVIKTAQTGEDDYHLYCHEAQLETVWNDLLSLGKEWGVTPVGQAALNILRIEAGIPRCGLDIDEERFPVEAGLEDQAISYTKGCYPGQEVVARTKTYGHVHRRLTGLTIEGPDIPKDHDTIFKADEPVGWITSSVASPLLNRPIAMAYLKNSVLDGEPVDVAINKIGGEAERVTAMTTKLPFYERLSPIKK
jgi:folate-binding protein YgfZ